MRWRWRGGGMGELEHLCDTEQQVRAKQMETEKEECLLLLLII